MIREILHFPDKRLTKTSTPVTNMDGELVGLIGDMVETMYDAPGVGLAAPQIGVSKRIFVFDAGEGPQVLVNAQLMETSDSWEFEEGCLSVPDRSWPIVRPGWVKMAGCDLEGKPLEFAGDELLGRVLQHELDHLNGTLLVERLDRRLRKAVLRELRGAVIGPHQ